MGILAPQIVDVQGHAGVVDQAVEEFAEQVDIEGTDHCPREIDMHFQAGTAGEVDYDSRQCFVERHVGMPVAGQPFLVAPGLGQCLTEGDADVFDRVMGVDMQIALCLDIEIDQAMAGDLVEHVVEKRNPGGKFALAGTVEIETHGNLRLQRVACDFGLPHG